MCGSASLPTPLALLAFLALLLAAAARLHAPILELGHDVLLVADCVRVLGQDAGRQFADLRLPILRLDIAARVLLVPLSASEACTRRPALDRLQVFASRDTYRRPRWRR